MPNNDKVKERMCVACRRRSTKGDLLRVVRKPDGSVAFDQSGKADGRGAYVCNSKECVETCVKKHLFNRAFKCALPDELYQALKDEYDKQNN